MKLETLQLASITFAKDKTKPCPVCGDLLEDGTHLECRKALRRTRGGRQFVVRKHEYGYWDMDKWH